MQVRSSHNGWGGGWVGGGAGEIFSHRLGGERKQVRSSHTGWGTLSLQQSHAASPPKSHPASAPGAAHLLLACSSWRAASAPSRSSRSTSSRSLSRCSAAVRACRGQRAGAAASLLTTPALLGVVLRASAWAVPYAPPPPRPHLLGSCLQLLLKALDACLQVRHGGLAALQLLLHGCGQRPQPQVRQVALRCPGVVG